MVDPIIFTCKKCGKNFDIQIVQHEWGNMLWTNEFYSLFRDYCLWCKPIEDKEITLYKRSMR